MAEGYRPIHQQKRDQQEFDQKSDAQQLTDLQTIDQQLDHQRILDQQMLVEGEGNLNDDAGDMHSNIQLHLLSSEGG